MNGNRFSALALIGTLLAIAAFGTAAVLFLASTDESLQRLALLFGLFGIMVPAIIGVLKADRAESQTTKVGAIAKALNGQFEERVEGAVQRGNAATERGEIPPPPIHPPDLQDPPA